MDEHGYDDEDELEPPWPGWKAMFSGRAGVLAIVIIGVVGFCAAACALQYAQYHADDSDTPAHPICIPLDDPSSGPGGAPASGPTAVCVPINPHT